jgi:hypothetical protein
MAHLALKMKTGLVKEEEVLACYIQFYEIKIFYTQQNY